MQFKPTPDFQVFPATVTWEQVNYPHPIWTKLQLSIVVYLSTSKKKFDSGLLFFFSPALYCVVRPAELFPHGEPAWGSSLALCKPVTGINKFT